MRAAESTGPILHLYPSYVPGQDSDLHTLLRRRGVASYVAIELLLPNDAGIPPASFVANVARPRPAFLARALRAQRRLLSWLADVEARRFFESSARNSGARLLHAHFGPTGVQALPLARDLGLPLVTTFYGYDASALIRRPEWQKRYCTLSAGSAAIIVLCDEVKTRFERIGCDAERVVVWDMPIDLDRVRYRPPRPDGTLRVLIAARFVEKKGHAYLLRALARVVRDGIDARLTAMGYGPGRQTIEALASTLGIADRVTVVDTRADASGPSDFLSQLQPRLDSHDVFAAPSIQAADGDDEGGPALTMVYAQAAGMPVVCTPFPGNERTMVPGETGLVVPEQDADALAEALIYLHVHRDEWERMGAAGSAIARERFRQDASVDRILEIYRSALKERSA